MDYVQATLACSLIAAIYMTVMLHFLSVYSQQYIVRVGLLTFICVFNPHIYSIIIINLQAAFEKLAVLIFVVTESRKKSASWGQACILSACLLNPSNILYYLHFMLIKKKMASQLALRLILPVICLSLPSVRQHYKSLYFPDVFLPQTNVLWIMYGHMFDRYLLLYQMCFIMFQVSSFFLLSNMKLSPQLKVILLAFIITYCNYSCPLIALLLLYVLAAMFLPIVIANLRGQWQSKGEQGQWKEGQWPTLQILTIIMVVGNLSFYPLNQILLQKYLTSFTINISYLFIFACIPWAINSIYLAEVLLLEVGSQQTLQMQEEWSVYP